MTFSTDRWRYWTRTHSSVFDMMPEPATISKPAGVMRIVIGTNMPRLRAKISPFHEPLAAS